MIWFDFNTEHINTEFEKISSNYINELAIKHLNTIDLNQNITTFIQNHKHLKLNTLNLISFCQSFLDHPEVINNLFFFYLYGKEERIQYFITKFKEILLKEYNNNLQLKNPAEIIFEALFIINFSAYLKKSIDNYFLNNIKNNNYILLDEVEFSFNFEDFFPEINLHKISKNLTLYIYEQYDKEQDYKVFYKQGIFYLINGFAKQSNKEILLKLANKAMQKEKLNQKQFIKEMKWNYKSFSEFKNNNIKKIWSEENIEEKIKEILFKFDLGDEF